MSRRSTLGVSKALRRTSTRAAAPTKSNWDVSAQSYDGDHNNRYSSSVPTSSANASSYATHADAADWERRKPRRWTQHLCEIGPMRLKKWFRVDAPFEYLMESSLTTAAAGEHAKDNAAQSSSRQSASNDSTTVTVKLTVDRFALVTVHSHVAASTATATLDPRLQSTTHDTHTLQKRSLESNEHQQRKRQRIEQGDNKQDEDEQMRDDAEDAVQDDDMEHVEHADDEDFDNEHNPSASSNKLAGHASSNSLSSSSSATPSLPHQASLSSSPSPMVQSGADAR